MSSSNCCFLTCIRFLKRQVWWSGIPISWRIFPHFVVIHTVKGFGIVNKAEIDVFLEPSCFFDDLVDVGNLISGSSAFSKSSLNIWKFTVHVLLKPGLENFKHYFTSIGQTGDGNSEHQHYRNQQTKMDWNGEFNSDDYYIYYCGQEFFGRNGVAIIVNKTVWNAVLGCSLKNDRMISVHFQGKPFNITVIQVYALTSNAEEAKVEQFYEDIQDLLELTPKKRCPFHYRGL